MSFKDIALPLIARGVSVVPVMPGEKRCLLKDWPRHATLDPELVKKWNLENPGYNVGCVGKLNGVAIIDCDVKGLVNRIEAETGHKFEPTFVVKSAGKGCLHLYYKHTDRSRAIGNRTAPSPEGGEWFSLRADDEYVVGPGSVLKETGKTYDVVHDYPIADFPDWLADWIHSNSPHAKKFEGDLSPVNDDFDMDELLEHYGITPRQRGKVFHVNYSQGHVHLVRGTLGTRHRDVALRLIHSLEIAVAEGARSTEWPQLAGKIPPATFRRFAILFGVKGGTTWKELRDQFECFKRQQLSAGDLVDSTLKLYIDTLDVFERFLKENNISLVEEITSSVVDEFKTWRFRQLQESPLSRGGDSIRWTMINLRHVFKLAVERGLIQTNPFRLMRKRRGTTVGGASPYSVDEVNALKLRAGEDNLLLLLLRWTGFRRSDAVILRWREVDLSRREIDHICRKNRKRVILPIHRELLNALIAEYKARQPGSDDHVLLNPRTRRKPFTVITCYKHIVALGKRAGVHHAHPHRFRDTFAVNLIGRGASTYYVAQMLGDTEGVLTKHYLEFVQELRERARAYLDSSDGLEQCVTGTSHIKSSSP